MEYECKCNKCGYITVVGFSRTETVKIAQKNKCQCGNDWRNMTIQPMEVEEASIDEEEVE
jgi:hypothetical protein